MCAPKRWEEEEEEMSAFVEERGAVGGGRKAAADGGRLSALRITTTPCEHRECGDGTQRAKEPQAQYHEIKQSPPLQSALQSALRA